MKAESRQIPQKLAARLKFVYCTIQSMRPARNGNGLLFHMTQPTNRSTTRTIACSKPTISEHQIKWKHNGTIADQCKQRGALCHIGLAKDRGGIWSTNPVYDFLTSVEKQQLEIKYAWWKQKQKTNERRTWWRKCTGESACLCT